jgi:RNA polymerase sigma-B factor
MNDIVIDTQVTEHLDLVVVSGSLDFASVAELTKELEPRLREHRRDVLLDLTGITVLDARAVSELLRMAELAENHGGQLQVIGARGVVLEVLQITGAAKQLGVYESSPQQATRQLSSAPANDPLARALTHLVHLPCDSPARRELRDRVVTDLLPLAAQLARRFRDRGESHEDLKQVAVLALINAVDRFDPKRGDFFPFAVTTMTGELKRHLRDRGWAVRPPRRLQELSIEVRWAESQLGQTLGRSPTAADIANYLDVAQDAVVEAMIAQRSRRSASLQAPIRAADVPLVDILGADDRRLDAIDCWVSLRSLIAELPSRTRRILEMRFGQGMTQTQIAEQVGLSQMHVSRILTNTMQRMREALEGEGQPEPAPRRQPRKTAKSRIRRRSI